MPGELADTMFNYWQPPYTYAATAYRSQLNLAFRREVMTTRSGLC